MFVELLDSSVWDGSGWSKILLKYHTDHPDPLWDHLTLPKYRTVTCPMPNGRCTMLGAQCLMPDESRPDPPEREPWVRHHQELIKPQASSIRHQQSSIKRQVSSKHQASRHEDIKIQSCMPELEKTNSPRHENQNSLTHVFLNPTADYKSKINRASCYCPTLLGFPSGDRSRRQIKE